MSLNLPTPTEVRKSPALSVQECPPRILWRDPRQKPQSENGRMAPTSDCLYRIGVTLYQTFGGYFFCFCSFMVCSSSSKRLTKTAHCQIPIVFFVCTLAHVALAVDPSLTWAVQAVHLQVSSPDSGGSCGKRPRVEEKDPEKQPTHKPKP